MSEKSAEELFDEPGPTSAENLFNEGEPGHPSHDPYAAGPNAPPPEKLTNTRLGDLPDAARSFVNTMTFGAAPQIEGAMGAVAKQAVEPFASPQALLDAYKSVRDEGAKQHAASAETGMGKLGAATAYVAPHPLLPTPAPGASVPRRVALGTGVGAGVGAVSGAANSPADLTSDQPGQAKRLLLDAGKGALTGGAIGGGLAGGMAAAQSPVRRLAEEQALRAAGLRGGIKNSLQKDLGIENMDDARALGREFLDNGLIPVAGSSEAVADRARDLQGESGDVVGNILQSADQNSQGGFDYGQFGNAARAPIMDPSKTTAVARAQAGKALDLADQLEAQGADTPGSFVGANRAKSDAWKGANFSTDPELSAVNYRKGVSAARQNIEDQVAGTPGMGPAAASALARANRSYGTAADALKLAENASTRDAAKKGLTLGDLLMLTSGGTAGGLSGHSAEGMGAGAAAVIGHKLFDKYGHSTAARGADALAEKFGESSGGHAGGMLGANLSSEDHDKLAPWEQFLHKDEEKKP